MNLFDKMPEVCPNCSDFMPDCSLFWTEFEKGHIVYCDCGESFAKTPEALECGCDPRFLSQNDSGEWVCLSCENARLSTELQALKAIAWECQIKTGYRIFNTITS